jgi:hypothetical protein
MARHRKRRGATEAETNPLPLTLRDVYLLTAESDRQLAVNGLGLIVDEFGLTVLSPEGRTAAQLAWSELTSLRTMGRSTSPAGEPALLLEATSAARAHQFLVPTEDPSALERLIGVVTGIPIPAATGRRGRRK